MSSRPSGIGEAVQQVNDLLDAVGTDKVVVLHVFYVLTAVSDDVGVMLLQLLDTLEREHEARGDPGDLTLEEILARQDYPGRWHRITSIKDAVDVCFRRVRHQLQSMGYEDIAQLAADITVEEWQNS
ncbi:MAG: hypothetical protein M1828_001895 [Chrysothrix sp. TS-e1954]|nr:MAG: hypothetical protein M1828_001895 [Chrysothrix sp. TS-e1954]